ncbi:MAG: hypothetical protein AAFQ52_17630, partial [Chloroflexota bacterium]
MAKNKNSKNSGASLLVGALVAIAAFGFYLLTGIDLLGVTTTEDTTNPQDTSEVVAPPRTSTGAFTEIQVGQGYGYQGDFWELYFTAPLN